MLATPSQPFSSEGQFKKSIEYWIAVELGSGASKIDLFKSMVKTGWPAPQSADLLKFVHDDYIGAGFAAPGTLNELIPAIDPALALQQALSLKVVPRPQFLASQPFIDLGDRTVNVLQFRQAPDLVEFEGFLSPDECASLIRLSEPKLARSTTVNGKNGGSQVHEARTSEGTHFRRSETELLSVLDLRISKLLSWPANKGEGLQVLRYGPGAEYKPHFDFFDPHLPGSQIPLKHGGQRVGTFLMYLNTPDEGGATVFPDINLNINAKAGNALFFSYAQAHPCSKSLHGGAPVISGEKWIATKWLREGEFVG